MKKYTQKTLPTNCPSCSQILKAARLICENCDTAVEGNFNLPVLTRLNPEDHEFVVLFLKSSGSLKDLAKIYGISYPTVRNRLDTIIERIKSIENHINKEVRDGNK